MDDNLESETIPSDLDALARLMISVHGSGWDYGSCDSAGSCAGANRSSLMSCCGGASCRDATRCGSTGSFEARTDETELPTRDQARTTDRCSASSADGILRSRRCWRLGVLVGLAAPHPRGRTVRSDLCPIESSAGTGTAVWRSAPAIYYGYTIVVRTDWASRSRAATMVALKRGATR